jgi:hypothetical protein
MERVKGYRRDTFINHIKNEHNLSLDEYFEGVVSKRVCACGCGGVVPITANGKNITIADRIKGHVKNSDSWNDYVERMSVERVGVGNPMFGKKSWNSGKTKETDVRLLACSEKQKGFRPS